MTSSPHRKANIITVHLCSTIRVIGRNFASRIMKMPREPCGGALARYTGDLEKLAVSIGNNDESVNYGERSSILGSRN